MNKEDRNTQNYLLLELLLLNWLIGRARNLCLQERVVRVKEDTGRSERERGQRRKRKEKKKGKKPFELKNTIDPTVKRKKNGSKKETKRRERINNCRLRRLSPVYSSSLGPDSLAYNVKWVSRKPIYEKKA